MYVLLFLLLLLVSPLHFTSSRSEPFPHGVDHLLEPEEIQAGEDDVRREVQDSQPPRHELWTGEAHQLF